MFRYFEESLKLADIENKQLIITEDLNCNLLEQIRSTCTAKLLEIFDLYLLNEHIQSPTRVTVRSQSIDVIITSIDDNKIMDSGVLELGISDHHLLYIITYWILLSTIWQNIINKFRLQYWARPKVKPNIEVET